MKNPSNAFENNQVLVNIKGVGIEPEYKGVPTSILDGKYSTPEKTDFSGTEPEKVDFADTAPRHDRFPVPESREFKSLVTAQNNSKTVEELLDTLRAYTEIPLKSLSNEGKDTDFLLGDFLAEFISGEINKAKTVQGVDLNFKIKGLPQFNDQLQRLLTEQKNFTQSPLGNPTQDVNVFSHDRRGAGEKAVFRASLNLPQSKTVAPIESGFLRPSEGTFGGERDLLGTKQRNGTLTPDEYFREMGKIDEKEDENKRVSNVKQPPIVTRFIARLKNFFSGVPTKSPFTSESEQPEPTMDTLTTRETPLLTHSTNNAKESNYELAKKAPDISDAKINIKYVKYPATPTGIHNPDNQVTSNTQYPLTTQPSLSQAPQKNLSTLTTKNPEKPLLGYSKENLQNLSKEQLNNLLKVHRSGLTQKQIDDIVDAANKEDKKKLPRMPRNSLLGNSEKHSEEPTVESTEAWLDKPVEGLFEDGLDAEVAELERRKKLNLQERLGDWRTRLGKVVERTTSKLDTALEKLGPEGKKLVSSLTQGSEYLNKNIDKRYKIFAGAGLLTAGALAAYASPVVLASIAGAGLGMRVISSAGIYIFARKYLDKKYKEWEKEGKKKNALTMVGMEASAVGFALFSGEMIGRAFEGIASSDLVRETAASIGDKVRETTTSLGDALKNIFGEKTITIPPVTMSSQPPVTHDPTPTPAIATPEITPEVPTNPDLEHIVKKGENLWSLLRGDLAKMDLPRFDELSDGAKERMMREIIDDTPVPSGNSDKIFPGDRVTFNGTDFQKYIDRQLQK